MADFLSNLRMASLFPTSGFSSGGIAPIDINSGMSSYQTGFTPNQWASREERLFHDFLNHQRDMRIAPKVPMDQMDVQYVPPANEVGVGLLDKLKLAEKDKELALKDQQETARLGFNKLKEANDTEIDKKKLEQAQTKQEQDNKIKEQRAAVYEYKAKNPGAKIVVQRGGNILAINPQTGATMANLGPSGLLSEEDKLAIEQGNKLEQIDVNNQNALDLQKIRGNQSLEQIRARGEETRQTQDNKPIPPELATQTRVRQFIAARELANSNPDYAKYFKFEPNDFSIHIPYGGDPKIATMLHDKIYGSSTTQTPQNSPDVKTSVAGQFTEMLLPDGKTRKQIPNDQVEAAKARGATVVKGK